MNFKLCDVTSINLIISETSHFHELGSMEVLLRTNRGTTYKNTSATFSNKMYGVLSSSYKNRNEHTLVAVLDIAVYKHGNVAIYTKDHPIIGYCHWHN